MHLPSTRYHRTEAPRRIDTEDEHDELDAAGWRDSPARFEEKDAARASDAGAEASAPPAKRKRKR